MKDQKIFFRNYEVEVTKENVPDMLCDLIIRLTEHYGPGLERALDAIAVGPNAFKAFELWASEHCMVTSRSFEDGYMKFRGIRILCSPMSFPVPIFNREGWHMAHLESKKVVEELGGWDA